jgi:hypothetical protein
MHRMTTAYSSARVFRTSLRVLQKLARRRRQTVTVTLDEAIKLLDKLDRVRAEKCAGPTGSPNRGGKDVSVDTDVPTTNASA